MAFLEDLQDQNRAALPRREPGTAGVPPVAGRPDAPELEPWDVAYYAEKQRAALYDFDEEALRPYFPLERVVAGMFDLVDRLYGIRVAEEAGVPVWDPQVRYYNVHDARRRVPGRLLRRLVSRAKTSAAAPGWMRSSPAVPAGAIPAAPRPDLRQPDAAGRRQAGAAHASRSGDHLPRVRPPAAPPAQPRGDRAPWRAPAWRGISSSCPRRSWRTGAGSARRWTCSRATGKPASRFPTTCSRR